ncbi:MAG: HdeD family acid-resistance protein [Methylocella sp.]|nr:MAG: hypothetical protein DLM68_10480 [Hyphomicrobiales bacterium]
MAYSVKTGPFPEPPENLRRVIESLRPRWRWIVALGVLIAGMGAVALVLVVSATIASVYTIAVFMIVAGAAEIATGLGAKTWSRFLVWIIAGLAYIVVAAFALAQPLIAAAIFTLLLGAGMIATGVVRIYLGAHLGAPLRRPVLLAGVLTALVGVLIVAGWPANSFVILGVLLGLDLAFWGSAWIRFGLRLRHYRTGDV